MKNIWLTINGGREKGIVQMMRESLLMKVHEDALLSHPTEIEGSSYQLSNEERRKKITVDAEAGFTLMELLIVLALVAVISMIAVPIYRNYVQSAKITEGMTLASAMQLDAEVYYALNGHWPESNQALGLPNAESYKGNSVDSIQLEGSQITVTFNDSIEGEEAGVAKLILTADVVNSGLIHWKCEGQNIKQADLPSVCKS